MPERRYTPLDNSQTILLDRLAAVEWDKFGTGISASCYDYTVKHRKNQHMAVAKRRIDIIVTEKEFEILEQYCEDNGQTKTAVIRELIRTLGAHTAAKAVESPQGG